MQNQPIRQIPDAPTAAQIDAKRRQAIAYLGENWILHPQYKPHPRHAFSADCWQAHSVLHPVRMAAQQAGRI